MKHEYFMAKIAVKATPFFEKKSTTNKQQKTFDIFHPNTQKLLFWLLETTQVL